jgi:hypothetical protein
MFALFLGLLSMFPTGRVFAHADPGPPYVQTYSILIKGAPSGTEQVKEELDRDGHLLSTSEHEIFVTDGLELKRLAFTTTMILSKKDLQPISYSCAYTSGETHDSYGLTIKAGTITRTLTRGGHSTESSGPVQPGLVVIDFNVYHHYDYLVGQYDAKKKGRQTFEDYLPLLGTTVPIALTQLDAADLVFGKIKVRAHNYKMEFIGIWSGTLSMDEGGRLVRLAVPSQDLEVVRKDLVPE